MKKQFLTLVFLAIAHCVFASKYYVGINGSNFAFNGSEEKPWASIAHALSQVKHGDTIVIGAGTFTEQSLAVNKNITIQGIGADYTFIQASESKPTNGAIGQVVFDIQADVKINGLTVRHGSPGIKIVLAGKLHMTDCNVIDCYSETPGAGINASGDLTMERCCVAYNTSPAAGAGIYASRSTAYPCEVIITNSTLSHNSSTGGNSMGGGLQINSGTLELRNSTVAYNSASTKGKGLHINSTDALVKVFTNNILAANGIPDIGANYATIFPAASDIDYNVISMAWAGYIDFGENTVFNTNSETNAIDSFVDSIALQPLVNAGSGVLAHAIDENSYLVMDKGGHNATTSDIRQAPRSIPDIGAYEHIAHAPMTALSILNSDTTILISTPFRIAVSALPSYTTESYTLSVDPASEAQVELQGDTLRATSTGMLRIWVVNEANTGLSDTMVFHVTDEIHMNSINLSILAGYPSVFVGEQVQFVTHVLPGNATDTSVTWSVDLPDLADISQDGLFTAKAIGTVTVTATSNEIPELKEHMEVRIVDNTPVEFDVNPGTVLKTGIANPSGAVICWLTDSDLERPRNRSMETALSEMKAGALRFPYGALSNNYLWTKDPQDLGNGIAPCVAVPGRAPGQWSWAVDEQGFFKKDLDFDEYVTLCRDIGAEPVVCVNIMSHVYKSDDHITIDTLIYYAREWVRYANITKDYGIKYWQLGNEQDHHSDIYPLSAFKADYKKMAQAMHEIDPGIMTAPGLLSKWNDEMLLYCPEYVDFVTCHQYLWFGGSETAGYDAWKNYGRDIIPHITSNQDHVSVSSKPDLEIFVTETGITGGKYPDPQVFNLYKGLILFEMQMEQIITPNVRHTFYWGTHTPWNGESGDSPLATLFSNDDANENHMQADVLTAINTHMQAHLLDKKTSKRIVSYATLSENDSLMVVFLLNKNKSPQMIQIATQGTGSFNTYEKWVFAGKGEYDPGARFKFESEGDLQESLMVTDLEPLSITILRMTLNEGGGNTLVPRQISSNEIRVYPNPAADMLHIEGETAFGKDAALTITNMAGKICLKQHNFGTSVINISALQSGVYTLQITDGHTDFRSLFIRK